MSFLKSIAGVFVEVEEKPAKKKESKAPVTTPPVYPSYVPVSSSVGEFAEHFKGILKEENERNFPGNDFYEFLVMKNGMSGIPVEEQRYVIAFSGLAAAGMSKEKLLSTADRYIRAVEERVTNFTSAYEQTFEEDVRRKEKIAQIKTDEMNELVKKIEGLSKEISQLKTESMESTHKLTERRNAFTLAAENQKNEILAEVEKINQYIK